MTAVDAIGKGTERINRMIIISTVYVTRSLNRIE